MGLRPTEMRQVAESSMSGDCLQCPKRSARTLRAVPGPDILGRVFTGAMSLYSITTIGACQNAAFCVAGSRTVT